MAEIPEDAEKLAALFVDYARLEAENKELKHLLSVSEDFPTAYADGKYKLYAMGGEICESAAMNLPMSEGPLDRACRKQVGRPQIRAEVEALAAANTRIAKLEQEARDAANRNVARMGEFEHLLGAANQRVAELVEQMLELHQQPRELSM